MVQRLIRRLFASYQKMSIQRVISLTFTAVSVAGLLFIGLSISLRYSAVNNQQQTVASQQVLNQVNLSLDNYLRRMMRLSDTLYYSVIKNNDLTQQRSSDSIALLYEENRDAVVSVAVFDRAGMLIDAAPLSQLKKTARPTKQSWFTSALDKIENIHFSTPHVQNLFQTSEQESRWVISLSRQVELTKQGSTQSGVLLVDMNFQGIEQICRNTKLSEDGYLYIIDQNGELIYHPRQQLIYAGLLQENNLQAAQLSDGSHRIEFQGQRQQLTVKTVGYTGWKLVGVVPVEGFLGNTTQLVLFVVAVLLFSIFLLIFVNTHLSAHIAEPIRELEQAVNRVGFDTPLPEISQQGCYEVRQLEHSIRSMVSTMQHLMEDVIRQEEDKRRSELEVLQAQINPHFLYNTLDSVIWLTESGRYEDAIQMVTALGRLFRISLSKGKSYITLADELEHADNYMKIQKIRYKNQFSFSIEVPPEAKQLYTLKLIIQPILENAIYHGMAAADDDGEIAVKVSMTETELLIDVSDNGMGMPPEVVERLLNERTTYVKSKGSGIGVRNVNRRIQLAFGEQYGLEFFSEPDEGTTVRIHLPVFEKKPGAKGEML